MPSKRIKGITIEIGGDTTKLTKALSAVDKQLSDTQSKLRDVDKLLKLNPGNVDLLRQKQKLLTDAISQTKDRLAQLREAQKNATNPADYDALQREIIETEDKLKSLETEYKQFGSVGTQQIAAVGKKFQEVGEKIGAIGKKMSTYVTLPLVGIGTKAASSFAEVDKTMQLTNKTMNNTAEEAETLNKAMKDAAANSTYGMSDAATATLNFARAGLDAKEASEALAPAMNLAAGEGGNLDTVSAGLVATINGFHGSFGDASKYADVFAAACNNSALDVNSLSESMSIAAPIFSAAGYSVNDAALYMGVMADNGIEANKAATSLKTGIARLVSPPKAAAEEMSKLDWSITNADGTMKSAIQIQKELHDKFQNLSEAERVAAASAIFGKNQMAPWLALIGAAPSDVKDLSNSLEKCAGTTEEMANAMMDGFGGSIEKLKSSIDVLMTSLGEALAPTIQKVTNFIQGLVDKFNALTPAQQQTIAKIGVLVAAAGPVLVVVGKVVGAIGTIMQVGAPLISGIGGLIKLIGGGLMSAIGSIIPAIGSAVAALGPVGIAIAAVAAAAVALGVVIYKNWDKIKAWTKDMVKNVKKRFEDFKKSISKTWENVKAATSKAWNGIKTGVTNGVNSVRNAVSTGMTKVRTAASTAWTKVRSVTSSAWGGIKSAVTNGVNSVRNGVSNGMAKVKTVASNAWTNVKNRTSSSWSSIKATVSGAISSVRSVASGGFTAIKTTAANAWSNLRSGAQRSFSVLRSTVANSFHGVYNAITSPLRNAYQAVRNVVSRIKNAFKFRISLPKIRLPHIRVTWLNVGKLFRIPRLSVQWYKKAYDNPMLFNSPTVLQTPYGAKGFGDGNGGELVYGHKQLMRDIAEASSGMNVTINITQQPGQDATQLANIVSRKLAQLQKQKEAVYA